MKGSGMSTATCILTQISKYLTFSSSWESLLAFVGILPPLSHQFSGGST